MADTLKQMYFGQPVTPSMTFTSVTSGSNTTDATTFVTASVTLTAGRLYLLSVENTHGTSASAVSAITGGAGVPTFTSRSTLQFNGTLNRITLLTAVPATNYTGTLTLNFGGTTQTGGLWSLVEVVGADTTTADGFIQAATSTGTGTTASVTTLTANTTDAYNGLFVINGGANASFTPGTNFAEIHDVTITTPTAALETEYLFPFTTSTSATLNTSAAWGTIGVEIKGSTTGFTAYTAPSGGVGVATSIIRGIQVCNTSGTSATFTLGIGGTASSKLIYSQFSVPAAGVHFANVNIVLTNAQTLQVIQGTSSALTAIISGVEL